MADKRNSDFSVGYGKPPVHSRFPKGRSGNPNSALVADAIMDCIQRGDLVLDGFLGSGTTIIAAKRTAGAVTEWSSIRYTPTPSCRAGRLFPANARVTRRALAPSVTWKAEVEKRDV